MRGPEEDVKVCTRDVPQSGWGKWGTPASGSTPICGPAPAVVGKECPPPPRPDLGAQEDGRGGSFLFCYKHIMGVYRLNPPQVPPMTPCSPPPPIEQMGALEKWESDPRMHSMLSGGPVI